MLEVLWSWNPLPNAPVNKFGIKNRLVVISFEAGFLYNNNLYLKEKKINENIYNCIWVEKHANGNTWELKSNDEESNI